MDGWWTCDARDFPSTLRGRKRAIYRAKLDSNDRSHRWITTLRSVASGASFSGRRNHYGSRSWRGTEVAALFYSLIESAKLCDVDPKRYLLAATHAALADRTAVTLPHTLMD